MNTTTAPRRGAITMSDARRMIIACYKADEPFLCLGSPGMGKSAMFADVAKELNIGLIDNRLTLKDPVDVGGMRVPDEKTGLMRHYMPDDLPIAGNKKHPPRGILLYEEINAVSMLLQVTAYGIIQERRIGQHQLLPGWVPMGTGNLVSDRAGAQRISTALANRFNVQVVEPHLPSWLEQYGSKHVDPRGCAFLRFRPELFHVNPKPDQLAFPSARSWTKAFKFMDEPPSFRRKIFAGYVGQEHADEFEAFWRVMEKAPTIDEIINDPKAARLPEERDAGTYYAVAGMVARFMDRKNVSPLMIYIDRMLPDYQVAVVQDAVRREPGLKNTNAYGQWKVKHQDVVL